MSEHLTGIYLSDDECRITRLALKMLFEAARAKNDYMSAEAVHRIAARIPERDGIWRPGERGDD